MIKVRVDSSDTKQLDSLLRFVAPQVPQVPYEMALDMLRQAYTEFARKTQLLVAHADFPIQRGVRLYALEPPQGYEVFSVLRMDGHHYRPIPDKDYWFVGWGTRFRVIGNSYVEFRDAPSQDGGDCDLAMHLLPNECATTIPSEVSVPYGKGIAMGALADMLDMAGQPWYNPRAAAQKRLEFNRAALSGRELSISNRGATPAHMKRIRVV